MNTARILTQAQAEAVYSAMYALNNVGGKIDRIDLEGSEVRVRENTAGRVFVESMERGEEAYFNQNDFAAAYGLGHGGEPQNAVHAAAGGMTQTAIER